MPHPALHFTASPRPEAQEALRRLRHAFGDAGEAHADIIVALGGDGHMLEVLRNRFADSKPVYGMNRGTIGFMLNEYREDGLYERLSRAESVLIRPLLMSARDTGGKTHEHRAVNEVSLLRQTAQMPRIRIAVDDAVRMEELFGDGVLLSTPAGSTGYNFSAHGPILPIGSNVLALTPINPFRPRRWPSAVLPHTARVRFDVLDPTFRPVSATADNVEVRDVTHVEIREDQSVLLTMLFDEGHALDEKVLREQFAG